MFIKTKSAIDTGVEDIVALWKHDEDVIYFCKKDDYIFPSEECGVCKENILYKTTDTELFYAAHSAEKQSRLKALLGLH